MAFAPFVTTYTPEPTRPASGPQPGALSLMDWVIAEWDDADAHDDADPHNLGIFVPRDICHNLWPHWSCIGSQHARGAALDVGFPDVGEGGHPEGWKYAHWLVANHAVLGVQEVIYARRRWTNQTLRWSDYHGPSPHLDHVHAALNASGARYLTRSRIESVAPRPPAVPTPPPSEDDMAAAIVKAVGSRVEWCSNGIDRRRITDRDEANWLALTGQATYAPDGKAWQTDPDVLARVPIRANP